MRKNRKVRRFAPPSPSLYSKYAQNKNDLQRCSKYKVNIQDKKIVLNFKSEDEEDNTFKLYFSGLSFPMPVTEVKIFERNNLTISMNVFGVDNENETFIGRDHSI